MTCIVFKNILDKKEIYLEIKFKKLKNLKNVSEHFLDIFICRYYLNKNHKHVILSFLVRIQIEPLCSKPPIVPIISI